MTRVLLFWGNWGPYHYSRFIALRDAGARAGVEAHGVELFPRSGVYAWQAGERHAGMHHLDLGGDETRFRPLLLLTRVLPLIARLRPRVVLVPSYFHWSLFLNVACRALGARIVMMNESHGGTERARGWRRGIKRAIVSRFHAALVGGAPHARYFASLGLPAHRIFRGYDAVDNARFAQAADAARAQAAAERARLALPARYFLSLGRFVEKKNLALLVRAYAALRPAADGPCHQLVFVGSGETEPAVRALCAELGLPAFDHAPTDAPAPVADARPGVHFYGFRQIDDNPVFYALATAFILPSLFEEWGLVVNEAMACALPVLVSQTAGCAEDLVVPDVNGFTFDPTRAGELAAALQRLIDDPALAERLGCTSRERIQDWGLEQFAAGGLAACQAALDA